MKIITITGGSLYTNCYMAFADDSDTCVLVDPGFDAKQILEKVRSQGKTVEAVFLTHGHFDHIGGVKEIAAQTGCRVYIHEADLGLPSQLTVGTVPATDRYGEGDTVTAAGLTFRVLHTPGHTPGGVCLLCEEAMFAGDTLFAGTCGRTDLPGSSPKQMRESLSRLAQLEGNYRVLPGHGIYSTLDMEKRTNPYLYQWN